MARKSRMAQAIEARIEKKREELTKLDGDLCIKRDHIDRLQIELAEVMVRRIAVAEGIEEDLAILNHATPEPRTKKAQAPDKAE